MACVTLADKMDVGDIADEYESYSAGCEKIAGLTRGVLEQNVKRAQRLAQFIVLTGEVSDERIEILRMIFSQSEEYARSS